MDHKKINRQGYDLINTFRKMKSLTLSKEERQGLSMPETHLLFLILGDNEEEKITPSEIAKKMDVTLPAITHLINSLEEKGIVERSLGKKDRRKIYINLTKKGKAKHKKIIKIRETKVMKIVEFLGEKDTDNVIRILKKLIDKFGKVGE